MTPVEFVVLVILGLRVDWQPEFCDHTFINERYQERCVERQERGFTQAHEMAWYFVDEELRYGEEGDLIPWSIMLAADGYKEGSLNTGDNCLARIGRDRIISMTDMTDREEGDDRVRLCIRYETYGGRQERSCTPVIIVEDEEGSDSMQVNRCAAGEFGTFQLMPHEVKAGTVVPATGEVLPRSFRERRERALDIQVGASLVSLTFSRIRERVCEDDVECRRDFRRWLGTYNSRNAATARQYGNEIMENVLTGLEYACEKEPDYPVCSTFRELMERRSRAWQRAIEREDL